MKKINILGVEYTIVYKDGVKEDEELGKCTGYVDLYTKTITINSFVTEKEYVQDIKDVKLYQAHILRHEVLHAFIFECGLYLDASVSTEAWALNEEMIDFFAIQWHKINNIYKELGV